MYFVFRISAVLMFRISAALVFWFHIYIYTRRKLYTYVCAYAYGIVGAISKQRVEDVSTAQIRNMSTAESSGGRGGGISWPTWKGLGCTTLQYSELLCIILARCAMYYSAPSRAIVHCTARFWTMHDETALFCNILHSQSAFRFRVNQV